MQFDHERLDVYRVALDFLVHADGVIRALPRGRAYFCDQLGRAALYVVLNIAEGAGIVKLARNLEGSRAALSTQPNEDGGEV